MLKHSKLLLRSINVLIVTLLTFGIIRIDGIYGSASQDSRNAKALYLKQRPGSSSRVLPFRNIFVPYKSQDANYQDYVNTTGKSISLFTIFIDHNSIIN